MKKFLASTLAAIMLVGVLPMAAVNAEERGTVRSYVVDDAKAGTLVFDYNRGTPMEQKRKGTKLWAYTSNNSMYGNGEYDTNQVYTSGATDNEYMGFVYKIDGNLRSVKVNTFGYGAFEPYVPIRTDIGYLIDDTVKFGDRNGDGKFTWGSSELQWYGTEGGVVGNAEAPIKLNENVWTKVSTSDCTYTYEGNDAYIETSAIPGNAKYMVVLLRLGTLDDGTEKLADSTYRYRGVTFTYESSIVKSELNAENKAVITLDSNAENVAWTVKKNGKEISDAQITYDSETFTYTVDGGFTSGDKVDISSYCGSFVTTVAGGSEVVDYDKIYFSTDKTNYIVGNTGKIDLITEKEGEKKYDLLPTAYTSSNDDVLSIDNKGNFTAKAAGTAVITPSVTTLSDTFEPITINIFSKAGEVRSFITEDVAAGKLKYSYNHRGDLVSTLRNGTKLWGYMSNGGTAISDGTSWAPAANTVYATTKDPTTCLGFIYKLDAAPDSIVFNLFSSPNMEKAKPRVEVGYITDENIVFTSRFHEQTGVKLSDQFMIQADVEEIVIGYNNWKAPIHLRDEWTKVQIPESAWSQDDNYNAYLTLDSLIPSDAKYVVILEKQGVIDDDAALDDITTLRYKGATFNYKTNLVGAELNNDNKIVLTMNNDVSDVDWTVKVNGIEVQNPQIAYDKNAFTYYIGGFTLGDSIEVSSAYGSYTAEIKDNREQIVSITLKDANGEATSEMLVDDTEYTVDVKTTNADGAKVYAALYDDGGRLVKCACTVVSNDSANVKLDGITIGSDYTLKAFVWNGMTPYPIYNSGVTNTFITGDF